LRDPILHATSRAVARCHQHPRCGKATSPSTGILLRALSRTSKVGATRLMITQSPLAQDLAAAMYSTTSLPPTTTMNGMGAGMTDDSGYINPAALNTPGEFPSIDFPSLEPLSTAC